MVLWSVSSRVLHTCTGHEHVTADTVSIGLTIFAEVHIGLHMDPRMHLFMYVLESGHSRELTPKEHSWLANLRCPTPDPWPGPKTLTLSIVMMPNWVYSSFKLYKNVLLQKHRP